MIAVWSPADTAALASTAALYEPEPIRRGRHRSPGRAGRRFRRGAHRSGRFTQDVYELIRDCNRIPIDQAFGDLKAVWDSRTGAQS